jgi:hypothetical protein
MDDAVGRNNSWHRLTEDQRDAKSSRLARVITDFGLTAIHCTIDTALLRLALGPKVKRDPFSDPFWDCSARRSRDR